MELEHTIRLEQERNYQQYKVFRPDFPTKEVGEDLIAFYYHLLEKSGRLEKEPHVRAYIEPISEAMEGVEGFDAAALIELTNTQGTKPAQFLAFWYPRREYGGLIGARARANRVGLFPKCTLLNILSICAADVSNTLKFIVDGTISPSASGGFWDLYRAQETFLHYEHKLDKTMAKQIKRLINGKLPSSFGEVDLVLAYSFTYAINKLGGIERYKQVREQLYGAHEALANSAGYTFPAQATVSHFRGITRKKLALYEQGLKIGDIQLEMASARDSYSQHPVKAFDFSPSA